MCCTLGTGVARINKVSVLNFSLLTVALNSYLGSQSGTMIHTKIFKMNTFKVKNFFKKTFIVEEASG